MTPTPTPVTPTPAPSPTPSSKNGPLPVIAGNDPNDATVYDINTTTKILTDPFITTNGVQDSGRIYRGGTINSPATASSPDGLPSSYFLGATVGPSAFDTTVGFDSQFGTAGDVAGFKFTSLALLGTPASISTAGDPSDLAFIATRQITDFATGTTPGAANVFDLAGLGNVLFATQAGSITFHTGLTFQNSGSTLPTLTLYARGGALDLEATTTFNLPNSTLNLYSDAGVTENAVFSGVGNVNMISGGGLAIGGNVTASGNFSASTTTAGGATPGGDLVLSAGHAIQANAINLAASGVLSIAGTLTSTGATNPASADISLAGASVDLGNASVTTAGSLLLTAAGGDVTVAGNNLVFAGSNGGLSATAGGGSLTLNPPLGAGGGLPLFVNGFATTGIIVNGDLTTPATSSDGTLTLTAHGGNVIFNPNTIDYGGSGNAPTGITLVADDTISLGTSLLAVPSPADSTAAGATISLTAGTTLNLGNIAVTAQGGTFTANGTATGGRGGSVTLQAAGAVTLNRLPINVAGGFNNGTGAGGSGGSVTVASIGAAVSGTTVALDSSTVFAANGGNNNSLRGTGGTINITSADASQPAPSPAPAHPGG